MFHVNIAHAPAKFRNAIKGKATLEACQTAYCELRDASRLGGSKFGSGQVVNTETGDVIARISYNGRAWPTDPWFDGMKPIAEAPNA